MTAVLQTRTNESRQYYTQEFTFACGVKKQNVALGYFETGNPNGPVVLVHPALSGSAQLIGEARGSLGWWDNVVGPDKIIDTNKYRVLAIEALLSPHRSSRATDFPDLCEKVAVIDTVNLTAQFLLERGISKIHNVIGCSFGGIFALNWANQQQIEVDQITTVSGVVPGQGVEYFKTKKAILSASEPYELQQAICQVLSSNPDLPADLRRSILGDTLNLSAALNSNENFLDQQKVALVRKVGILKYVTPHFLTQKENVAAWLDVKAQQYVEQIEKLDLTALVVQTIDFPNMLEANFAGRFHIVSQTDDLLFPQQDSESFSISLERQFPGRVTRVGINDQGTGRGHDFFLARNYADVIGKRLLA